jgi:CBS domain containing-hemolysin-like protein
VAEEAFVGLFCLGLFVTFVAAIALKSIQEVAWHELQEYCKKRRSEELFSEIHDKSDNAALAIESTQIVGVLFSTVIGIGWYLEQYAARHLTGAHLAPVIIVGTVVYFAATLWIPREVATWFGAAYLTETWPVWRMVTWFFTPFGWLSRMLQVVFQRASGETDEKAKERELEDEIKSLVLEGHHEKALPTILREMIEGVIQLDDLCARDIMRHRSEIDGVNVESPYHDVLKQVVDCGRTRLPVYEKNVDNIIGTLYVKDLLKAMSERRNIQSIREILRPHQEIPETVSLHELLTRFLHEKSHQAIVVDEFNATLGLVTIEDILEEIVGEIVDESEVAEAKEITHISPTIVSILADAHIDDINEQLLTNVPSGYDYNTLGGFIIKQLNDIPKPGQELIWNGLLFYVEDASKRQVKRVRLTLVSAGQDTVDHEVSIANSATRQ